MVVYLFILMTIISLVKLCGGTFIWNMFAIVSISLTGMLVTC
jgi:hypothetical protein